MSILNEDEKRDLLHISKESIIKNSNWIVQLEEIFNFFELYPQMKSSSDNKKIIEKARSIVDDLLCYEDYELLDDELTYLVNIQEKHKIDFSEEIDDIEYQMFTLEEKMSLSGDPDYESYMRNTIYDKDISDEEIAKKFTTLLED